MALVIHTVGERTALDVWFAVEDFQLHLYSNDYTPSQADSIGSYTEVSGASTGYAAKTLAKGSWGAASTDGSQHTTKTYAAQTFNFTGAGCPVTVYGYYVTTAAGVLLWGEKVYAAGQSFPAGSSLTITPTFELGNGTPT
jgi:hypothetical protein